MSVENQARETTAEAVNHEDEQKSTVADDQSLKSTNSETISKAEELKSPETKDPVESSEKSPENATSSRVREWFEKLSVSERVSALAFVDGPFLGALMAYASWSPPVTPGSSGLGGAGTGEALVLEDMVDTKGFESRLRLYEQGQTQPPKADGDAKDSEKHNQEINEADVVAAEALESDALRIRPQEKQGEEETHTFPVLANDEKSPSFDVLRGIFEQLVVTFPSAFKHATGSINDERFPVVSLKPSCFEQTGDKDLFLALDAISTYFFGARFLAEDTFEEKSPSSWFLSRLRRRQYLPLGALIVANLECAVMKSFLAVKEKGGRDEAEIGTKSEPALQMLVSKLISKSYFDKVPDHSPEILKDLMEPFVSAFGVQQDYGFESLVFTPIQFLRPSENGKDVVDFSSLDRAVGKTLQRMTEKVFTPDSAKTDKRGAEASSDLKAPNESQNQIQSGGHKKKKRKTKKRKNKKQAAAKGAQNPPSGRKENDTVASTRKGHPVSKKSSTEKRKSDNHIRIEQNHASQKTDDKATPEETATTQVRDTASLTSADSSHVDKPDEVAVGSSAKREATRSKVVPEQPRPPSTSDASESGKKAQQPKEVHEDDGDTWETVEVRGRGSRKRGGGQGGPRHNSFNDNHGNSKKTKGARTVASRKKVANRKVAREILSSILDKVDDEVKRKKPVVSGPVVNPWKVGSAPTKTHSSPRRDVEKGGKKTGKSEKTLRDVVMGGRRSAKKGATSDSSLQSKRLPTTEAKSPKRDQSSRPKASPSYRSKGSVGAAADQNTAPTYQETVSAVSTPSNAPDAKEGKKNVEERASKADSSNGTEGNQQNGSRHFAQQSKNEVPPLPTLLSPENANSANSSVASSLEVPHASRLHSNSMTGVNDVGYHLLDVCDRLSRDMSLFMSRRALALSSRRRERGALLAALQDTVSDMWPGRCHVEMYGSCATQLDLPSSDIDVVVVGLDRMMVAPRQSLRGKQGRPKSTSSGNLASSKSFDESATADEPHHVQMQRHHSMASYVQMPVHLNGDRVRRLAAELESQPWAVRVNAIPTASVPVIKVLCDPSRLTGASNGGDWMTHHEQMAAQAAAAAGNGDSALANDEEGSPPPFPPQQLPWRGSDVMNGLLSLDITFEGPEHGGIGSTEFSARVVSEACQEAGLHPDATPFVQVLMVLKEILGQRKLNEPYSGGLSSYALLLLVVALLRDRAVIREEIERVERQRRAMAAGDGSASFAETAQQSAPSKESTTASKMGTETTLKSTSSKQDSSTTPQATTSESRQVVSDATSKTSASSTLEKETVAISESETSAKKKGPASSSWASVAKKQSLSRSSSTVSQGNAAKPSGKTKPQSKSKPTQKAGAKPSFADAVAKSSGRTAAAAKKASNSSDATAERDAAAPTSAASEPQKAVTQKVQPVNVAVEDQANSNTPQPSMDAQLLPAPSFFEQGFNDIVEVLCSGETTAGKLLMHFLLYYGEHFDAQSTAIDISGKHERHYMNQMHPYSYMSPFIHRQAPGSIDPITGMLIVDPIVIYDPLEGAENNNVARRCFAWNSVRWSFAQSYATLSSAVERSATPPATGGKVLPENHHDHGEGNAKASASANSDTIGDLVDPSSPLLRCLISF